VITEEGKSWSGLALNLSDLLVVSTWNSNMKYGSFWNLHHKFPYKGTKQALTTNLTVEPSHIGIQIISTV